MLNRTTVALTKEQYKKIIDLMKIGTSFFKQNLRIACCLTLQANLGLRIGDVLNLKLMDIVKDGDRYRLNIIEQKTSKKRTFTVPLPVYQFIKIFCIENNIKENEKIFKIGVRNVQRYLKKVVDYLGYKNISTHSFRKFFATQIYNDNNHDIRLVQVLLQHSSPNATQRYIGVQPDDIENALNNHICIV